MANTPTPRSYPAILGRMVDTVSGRLGVNLRAGDPSLSILEAAAHSDLRSSVDLLQMLAMVNLDRATGDALDRIGQSEGVDRPQAGSSYGTVTISDSRFTRTATKIYQGLGGVAAGVSTFYVENGLIFAVNSDLYIGRGTTNYEGPLRVQSVTDSGGYYTIVTYTPTARYHNPGEDVVLAQGGIRSIPVGTTLSTTNGPAGSQIQFRTVQAAALADGEVSVSNIRVVALLPGSSSNVAAGVVSQVSSAPFTGAAVTNPAPFTTGTDTYQDDAYRELIRTARATRSKGTALAIRDAVRNASSSIENRKVLSSQLINREGEPATLYIDDGTGYEETTEGVSFETLTESAIGGEQYFALSYGRPVSKAFVESTISGPFALEDASTLDVMVGGALSSHSFAAGDFLNINHANAYEVVQSINANPLIDFSARTAGSGSKVVLVAKASAHEDLQVIPVTSGTDANLTLGFPGNKVHTLYLYKNDQLLTKDGVIPTVESYLSGAWATVSDGATLVIEVDGISQSVTVNDADFVTAGTGYGAVSQSNSVDAWAAVFNSKIAGITATASNGRLVITSNLGASNRASLAIVSGTISTAMFGVPTATGSASDYTLDPNLGLIKLTTPLVENDRLTAGSTSTRMFYETTPPDSLAVDATMWWFVDGNSSVIETRVGIGTVLTVAVDTIDAAFDRVTITPSSTFGTEVQKGDWLVINDSGAVVGATRIAETNGSVTSVEIESAIGAWVDGTYTLAEGKLQVVRSTAYPQYVSIASGSSFTATSYAAAIDIKGATAEVYRTRTLRVRTNTFGGDVLLAGTDTSADTLGLALVGDGVAHLGGVLSRSQLGTPSFVDVSSTATGAGYFTTSTVNYTSDKLVVLGKPINDTGGQRRGNQGFVSSISTISTLDTYLREYPTDWLESATYPLRVWAASPYSFTPDDQLSVLVDQDVTSKQYIVPMGRALSATGSYGSTITVKDYATEPATYLSATFGTDYDFQDYAVWMSARVKTHPATTKAIVWRYNRLGAVGNNARMAYAYPLAPSTGVAMESSLVDGTERVLVRLPSGAARTGWTIRSGSKVGIASGTTVTGVTPYAVVSALAVTVAARVVYIDYTKTVAGYDFGGLAITGLTSGATANVAVGGDSNPAGGVGSSGTLTLSSITGSFILGEAIQVGAATKATAATTAHGVTTLTLTLPSPTSVTVSNHGIPVGSVVYFNAAGGGYSSGAKTVHSVPSATQIAIFDEAILTGVTTTTGAVSLDPSGILDFGSTVAANDIMYLGGSDNYGSTTPNNAPLFTEPVKLATKAGSPYYHVTTTLNAPPTGGTVTTLEWVEISDSSLVKFYPIDTTANTITDIATAANTLESTLTAVAVGDPTSTGQLDTASWENSALTGTVARYSLTDGINWVRSTNTPANTSTDFTFTFKDTPNSTLATGNSDWANETLRLVPVTAKNVSDWVNQPATSGLFSVGTAELADSGNGLQLATATVGRSGSIAISGGTANELSALVKAGPTSTGTTTFSLPVLASDALALVGQSYVKLTNSVRANKNIFDSSTTLTSIVAGVVTTNTTSTTVLDDDSGNYLVEPQGNGYVFMRGQIGDGVPRDSIEGDWVIITTSTGNALNTGTFRVVRVVATGFWIENPQGVLDQNNYGCKFVTYNSIIPGDQFVLDGTEWGSTGTWTVTAVTATTFTVDTGGTLADLPAPGVAAQSVPAAKIYEAEASSLTKRIATISAHPSNPDLVDVQFDTKYGWEQTGASFGTVLTANDKLGFDSYIATGVDGYSHTTGLIEEANRIVYGDESQAGTYPGVAAAGSRIDISGPQVRRIDIGVAIRTNTSRNVEPRVQSAIAAVINSSPVGQPIAIAGIVSAAMAIGGITSVVVTSPEYAIGKDLISIQPYEKPLVFDLSSINVTVIGD